MAKSLRASRVKTNKQKLRKNVFAPVDDARIDRLSAKLAEIVAQKKPSEIAAANVMEVDDDANKDTKQTEEAAMDVDTTVPSKTKLKKLAANSRDRRRVSKNRKAVVFPSMLKKQQQMKAKSKGKVSKR